MEKEPLIVLPCYNSDKYLTNILYELRNYRDVLIIDDGSTDGSKDIIEQSDRFYLINKHNEGVSSSIIKAINFAKEQGFDKIVTLDSDGQHETKFIPFFFKALENADLVCGNRFLNCNSIPSNKISSNYFASFLTFFIFKTYIPDVACGFRGYNINNINMDLKPDLNGFMLIYDFLFQAIKDNRAITTVPISPIYYYDNLLCTRKIELLSLVNALLRHDGCNVIKDIFYKINLSINFEVKINETIFYFFYVSDYESYIIQTDLKCAKKYFEDKDNE